MPVGSYKNKKTAENNARQIINKTRCDAVKIESNKKNHIIIHHLVKKKFQLWVILVTPHNLKKI